MINSSREVDRTMTNKKNKFNIIISMMSDKFNKFYIHPFDTLNKGRVGPIFLGKTLHNFATYWLATNIAGSFYKDK